MKMITFILSRKNRKMIESFFINNNTNNTCDYINASPFSSSPPASSKDAKYSSYMTKNQSPLLKLWSFPKSR